MTCYRRSKCWCCKSGHLYKLNNCLFALIPYNIPLFWCSIKQSPDSCRIESRETSYAAFANPICRLPKSKTVWYAPKNISPRTLLKHTDIIRHTFINIFQIWLVWSERTIAMVAANFTKWHVHTKISNNDIPEGTLRGRHIQCDEPTNTYGRKAFFNFENILKETQNIRSSN